LNEEHGQDLNALAAHLEGRLKGDEERKTLEHLSACVECRETAALLARSWPTVRAGNGARTASDRLTTVARSPWLALAAVLVVGTAVAIRLLPASSPAPDLSATAAPTAPTSPAATSSAPAVPAPLPTGASGTRSRVPSPGVAIDETLLATRGGVKRVAGKTFRLRDGEWIDSSFDRLAPLPVVEIAGAGERDQILARVPQLAPYAALGDRVRVVFDGTVYRFRAATGR